MKLGEYIRQQRDKKDLSLREFAAKLGRSPAFISDIELGRRNPSKEVLVEMAKFFNVSVEEMEKYDERVVVEEVKKIAQTNPPASATIGVLLRKAASGKNVTESDMKKLMDQINNKKK